LSKILITGDSHIHNHKNSEDRLKDCVKALDWVFETAYNQKISNILFLGDLFHSRQKINVNAYQWTFETFLKWMKMSDWNPTVYLFVGNHDMAHKFDPDVCSVKPLMAIDGVKIIDTPQTLQIDKHYVSFMPYTEDPISVIETFKDAPKELLLGHIALDGAILNSVHHTQSEVVIEHDGDMKIIDANVLKEWKQVFLGHYHGGQKVGNNIEYVGSPLELSFGEAFQEKHLIIYDLDTKEEEYVINDFSPKHLIITQNNVDKYDLTNNFIRIVVDNISSSDLVDFKNDLLSKDIGSLDIRQKPKINEDSQAVDAALSVILHNDLIVEKYVECMDDLEELKGLDKKILLEVGNKIINIATNNITQ
jgi:DNA repair exonuclease SbcCD nuclease subunit